MPPKQLDVGTASYSFSTSALTKLERTRTSKAYRMYLKRAYDKLWLWAESEGLDIEKVLAPSFGEIHAGVPRRGIPIPLVQVGLQPAASRATPRACRSVPARVPGEQPRQLQPELPR